MYSLESSPAGITSFTLIVWSLNHPRLLGGTLMIALGIAYMAFGNTIVDPYSKPITVDKQDWVSKTILAIQVSLYYITSR